MPSRKPEHGLMIPAKQTSVSRQRIGRLQHRWLGFYVTGVAVAQMLLYLTAEFDRSWADLLVYFDPRLGLFFLESLLHGERFPGILDWASAGILACVGLGLLRNPRQIRWYLIVEFILGLPTVLFCVLVVVMNVGPSHGFSVGELLYPILIFILASVIPFAAGCAGISRGKTRC